MEPIDIPGHAVNKRAASRDFDVELCRIMGWKATTTERNGPDLCRWDTGSGYFDGTPSFTSDLLDALALVDWAALQLRGMGTVIMHVGFDSLGIKVAVVDVVLGQRGFSRGLHSAPGGESPLPLAISRAVFKFVEAVRQGKVTGVTL